MSIINSNEMYRNMKAIPSEDSSEYEAFALEEWRKVRDGINIGGVHISGWLYWHLNHWKLQKDTQSGERITGNPDLRDNEWMIAEALKRGEDEKKIVCIFGARQISKTSFASSYLTRKGTIITNSQNLIIGASKPDLTNITNDIDFGMLNITPMFRMYRITRDWKSGEVYIGVKSKIGDNQVHSMFRVRNTEGGRNTEVAAGARPSSAVIDEAGKGKFSAVLSALLPGMMGEFGLRAPVIVTGTGGDFEEGRDAEMMFFNPDSNNIVDYVDEITKTKTGLFMPGWLKSSFKKESNLAAYLGIESEELAKVEMKVSDKELAIKTLREERKTLSKDPDPSKLLKATMYFPLETSEIFLTETGNIFPKELLLEQKSWLAAGNAPPCDYVELYTDSDNIIRHKFTDKKPILNYPHNQGSDNIDGVIQIWEFPIHDSIPGLYIAATDPYKQEGAKYSDSVGSTYIFKRIYNPMSDKFQNIIVAAYHGRPRRMQTWYDNTMMLLKFYSAKTVCENEDRGFIQHCKDKNQAHVYLVPQVQQVIDGVHPNSTVQREYGIHATPELVNYFNTSIVQYMQDTLKTEKVEGESIETLGVRRIIDPLLIEELLKYDGKKNADRVRAFGIVLSYAKSLDRSPISNKIKDNRWEPMKTNNITNNKNPFRRGINPFSGV